MSNQVTVPQFIEAEDKIFGPITVRQFVIIFFAGILTYVLFKVLSLPLFIFAALVLDGVALIVAFMQINGQPFHYFLLHFVNSSKRAHLRVWRRSEYEPPKIEDIEVKDTVPKTASAPRVTGHRLHDISLVLDTGGAYHDE